jgi:hypothetical protein
VCHFSSLTVSVYFLIMILCFVTKRLKLKLQIQLPLPLQQLPHFSDAISDLTHGRK